MTARNPRWTRRRFLKASASVSALAAAAALVGCDEASGPSAPVPSSTAAPQRAAGRGGILRSHTFDAGARDSFDPHLTRMGPIVNLHSAVFSRILHYEDERTGTIAPDLADGMPEQPDELTYIVHLRPGVRFHDTARSRTAYPNVAGRELTAADLEFNITRQLNTGSPQRAHFYRSPAWDVIERIDVRDPHTLVIRLKAPTAPFLAFLAGRHAFIVPPEVVGAGDRIEGDAAMIGSGPFVLDAFDPEQAVRFRRNPGWFARDDAGGPARPFLDGYDAMFSLQDDQFQQVAFDRRWVDITRFEDPAALMRAHKTNLADIVLEEADAGGLLATRFLLDRPPFQDDRVRRALHLAIDRAALAEAMLPSVDGAPSAKLTGPVAPAASTWAMAQVDLLHRPGYRGDPAGREDDLRTARELWSAAQGEAPLGELRVHVAGLPKIVATKALPALQEQLRLALGVAIAPGVDPSGDVLIGAGLGRNREGASDGVVACTLMFEDGGVDLDDWLYPHFHSGGTHNTYRLQDATLDALLEASRAEFDVEARRQIGLDIQDYLLTNVNARLEYFAPVGRRLAWGYVRNSHHPMWYGSDNHLAGVWLDTKHPAWPARPA